MSKKKEKYGELSKWKRNETNDEWEENVGHMHNKSNRKMKENNKLHIGAQIHSNYFEFRKIIAHFCF